MNLRPPRLTPLCPRDESRSRPQASSWGPRGAGTSMASAAEGRSWALRLAMCRRSVLSLCGKASLRSRGTLNLAAVHRTAATQYTEAWVGRGAGRGLRTAPKWGASSEPGGLTTDPELQARLTNTHRRQSLSMSRRTWAPATSFSLFSTRGRWPHGGSRPGVPRNPTVLLNAENGLSEQKHILPGPTEVCSTMC